MNKDTSPFNNSLMTEQESKELFNDLLDILRTAITIAKTDTSLPRYTALVRSLSAFKTANEIAAVSRREHKTITSISPETIRLIEEQVLGIRREQ